MKRRHVLMAALALMAAPVVMGTVTPAEAKKADIYQGYFWKAALNGYDTVAYHTVGKPVEGSSKFQTDWKGAKWFFASKENLDKFKSMPDKYAPQYGGYCAYGVSQGAAVKGDPLLWKVVDGKLYVNINKDVVKIWNKDIPGYIQQANSKWPTVLGN